MASDATKYHIFQQLFSIKILTKLSYGRVDIFLVNFLNAWLKKEVEALSRQLVENGIDDKTFARRRSLLEKRWSENV